MTRALLVAAALALLLASPAAAEPVEITAQAKAARATFLLTATPPRPAAAICLIDTGVNVNPDTPAVADRFAVYGEAFDRSPTLHGTQIASFIAAPRNSYGMVGFWPNARLVSVRANITDQDAFIAANYYHALILCDEAKEAYDIKVVLLAFSSNAPLNDEELFAITDVVAGLKAHDVNIVAAAGNSTGGAIGVPSNLPGVLAVGASQSTSGALCSFSAAAAPIQGPGCGLDSADPATGTVGTTRQGTDVAAALVATALAALRTWRPELSASAAERLILNNARPAVPNRNLDVARTFVSAGLDEVAASEPSMTESASPTMSDDPGPPVTDPGANDRRLPARLTIDGPSTRRLQSTAEFWLKGHLRSLDGDAIAGADVTIQTRGFLPKPHLPSGPTTSLKTATTNTAGAFRVRVPAGPSRSIIASYSPTATDTVDVTVPARVTLRAKRRHIHNGEWAFFTGRVAAPIPYSGVPMGLEVRNDGRWVPVPTSRRAVTTTNDGRFTFSYRFLRTFRPTNYRFRAIADEDSSFQYTRGASRTVTIHVRP